jgi:hypothetical protein
MPAKCRTTAIDKAAIFDPPPACSAFRLRMNGKTAALVGRSRSGAGASCTVSKPSCALAPVLQNPPSADVCKGDACKGLVAKIWDRRVRFGLSQPDGPETGSAPRWDDDKAKPGIRKCRALVMARTGTDHSGPTVGYSVVLLISSPPRVFQSEKITPVARIAKVMPNDQLAGNFSHPIRSATKIFDPMNTSKSDSAYFR